MTRLVAAVAAVACVAVGAAGAVVLTDGDDDGGASGASVAGVPLSTPGPWTPEEGGKFQEPKQIIRPKVDGPTDINVRLHAGSGLTTIAGSQVYARTYNGDFVGPTIHARPGDTIKVSFDNDLGTNGEDKPVLTNIHYHGLHVSPEKVSDNIFRTFRPKPDEENPYASIVKLDEKQPRGTYWYHAHFHGISDGQVMGGLSGLIMLDGLTSLLPDGFKGVPERQVTLRDVQLAKTDDGTELIETDDGYNVLADNKSIEPAPRQTFRLVNGQYKPKLEMRAGEYELWHLANIGSDVFYKVALAKQGVPADTQRLFIVAEDGLPVWEITSKEELLIPPGKRFDVLVLGRAEKDGEGKPVTYELLTLPYAQTNNANLSQNRQIPCEPSAAEIAWPDCKATAQTLATITTAGDAKPGPSPGNDRVAPEGDPTAADLRKVDIAEDDKETFIFDYPTAPENKFTPVMYTQASSEKPGFEAYKEAFDIKQQPIIAPVLGATQEWTLVNKTRDDHPFHIHVNGFQVTQVTDENGVLQPYDARGHQDVVNIPRARKVDGATKNGQVVIRQKYLDFDGWYVFHCHILNHEDAGMMRTIQIRKNASVDPSPPPEADEHDAGGHNTGE
ncbi:MAG TPA: multicopper oxidase family protein [Solirubrobacteraceae bacterium]|jgi:FtsP/CotA-like multicopper oxidase with cupredoxin domain|nr:multicopper oxidase family protein [Solirubrobacteraceae bacterium]